MEEIYNKSADLFKTLSSPIRLQLIQFISFCPRTVEECATKTNQSIQNISLHLANLTKIGVLKVEKIKNYRFYQMADNELGQQVLSILRCDRTSLLDDTFICHSLSKDEAKHVKIIDLRSPEEASYIPLAGAYSFTDQVSRLHEFLKTFKKSDKLVFVCKGRLCPRLASATLKAVELGYKIKALALDAGELKEFSASRIFFA